MPIRKFPLAPMEVLAHGSAHATPSARPPIDPSGNFSPHMSAESPQKISPTPQKSYPKFKSSRTSLSRKYLYLADFPVKIGLIGEVGDVPDSSPRL